MIVVRVLYYLYLFALFAYLYIEKQPYFEENSMYKVLFLFLVHSCSAVFLLVFFCSFFVLFFNISLSVDSNAWPLHPIFFFCFSLFSLDVFMIQGTYGNDTVSYTKT